MASDTIITYIKNMIKFSCLTCDIIETVEYVDEGSYRKIEIKSDCGKFNVIKIYSNIEFSIFNTDVGLLYFDGDYALSKFESYLNNIKFCCG